MKILLIACALVGTTAQAQEIACPRFYPSDDMVLTETPYQHTGKGVLKKQELSGASWMGGELNDTFGELVGATGKVKGGDKVVVPGFAKWFVCWYGGGRAVAWWEELKPETTRAKPCTIQIRNKNSQAPMNIKLVCK